MVGTAAVGLIMKHVRNRQEPRFVAGLNDS